MKPTVVASAGKSRVDASITSSWQSAASASFNTLAGKRITLTIRSKGGVKRLTSTVKQLIPQKRFLKMFNNSGWYRPHTTTGTPSVTTEDTYNFCADGRYFELFTSGSGIDYHYQGTWSLGAVQAGVVSGYNIVEGVVTTIDQDAAQLQFAVDLSEQLPNVAYVSGNEYTRVGAGSC